jgi:hypothetical protein
MDTRWVQLMAVKDLDKQKSIEAPKNKITANADKDKVK